MRYMRIFFIFIFCFFLSTSFSRSAPSSIINIVLDDETINPVTADYIIQAIDRAENINAECVIIHLDTPGGLLTSTRKIVKRILTSNVPVVVYIAPSGSRAGSAGTFITYAGHVAVMAPSTNIGAAHPVSLEGVRPNQPSDWQEIRKLVEDLKALKSVPPSPDEKTTTEKATNENAGSPGAVPATPITPDANPMESKIVQDTSAFIRAIASQRGRNAEWAVRSVVQSESITDKEALEKGVIDFVAVDDSDLLKKLDGRTVMLSEGAVTIHTQGAVVETMTMDARQKFFNVLANPNIAYILMVLGFFGLLFEVTHPGVSIPGILGAIFLILAFYSLQTLPTNFAGVALTVLGIILLISEAFLPGFGMLFVSGLVCMVLGAMLLFNSMDPIMRVSMEVVIITGLILGGLAIFLVRSIWKALRAKTTTGKEAMLGALAKVEVAIEPGKEGKVFIHGELWNAVAATAIPVGENVRVTKIDGLTLTVEKI